VLSVQDSPTKIVGDEPEEIDRQADSCRNDGSQPVEGTSRSDCINLCLNTSHRDTDSASSRLEGVQPAAVSVEHVSVLLNGSSRGGCELRKLDLPGFQHGNPLLCLVDPVDQLDRRFDERLNLPDQNRADSAAFANLGLQRLNIGEHARDQLGQLVMLSGPDLGEFRLENDYPLL
jgi:hypothetical protein